MTTPNFTPDVPQWCDAAANEIRNTPSGELSANNIASIIAKHAPKPEATPAPATTDAGEVQAATPKWPRYFGVREKSEWRWVQHKPKLLLFYKQYDGGMTPSENTIDEILMRYDVIETDADGNALTQPVEPQQASGVEREFDPRLNENHKRLFDLEKTDPWIRRVVEDINRIGLGKLSNNDLGTIVHRYMPKAADHDAAIAAKCAEIESLKHSFKFISHSLEERNKDALAKDAEIKRLENALDENWTTHQQIINARTVRNGEYDKLHAMLVAEQQEHGRTGVELNEYVESCKHWRQRAEAAESKCAELENLRALGTRKYRCVYCAKTSPEFASQQEAQAMVLMHALECTAHPIHRANTKVSELEAQLAAANDLLAARDQYIACLKESIDGAAVRVAALVKERDGLREAMSDIRFHLAGRDCDKIIKKIDAALAKPSAEVGG